jgi:hypothetical protein
MAEETVAPPVEQPVVSMKEAFANFNSGVNAGLPPKETPVIPIVEATNETIQAPVDQTTVEIDLNAPFALSVEKTVPQEEEKAPEGFEEYIGKKFAVKSLSEVSEKLSKVAQLEAELLEARSKTAEPAFADEASKKLYDYCKAFDGTNASKIAEFDRLQSLNPATISDADAIRELYIMENRDMGRAKAERKFEMDFEDYYDTSKLSKEGLDPIEDADRIRDINRQIERRTLGLEQKAYEARQKLAQHVSTYKIPERQAAQAQQQNQPDLAKVNESIGNMVSNAGRDLGALDNIVFELGRGEHERVSINPGPEASAHLKNMVTDYYSNPYNYNPDGTLTVEQFKDPKTLVKTFVRNVYPEAYDNILIKRGMQLKQMEINNANKIKTPGMAIGQGKEDSMEGMTPRQKFAAHNAATTQK